MIKKLYIKPEIEKIVLDNSISLQMQSTTTVPTGEDGTFKPRTDGSKSGSSEPFASPFGDRPFK